MPNLSDFIVNASGVSTNIPNSPDSTLSPVAISNKATGGNIGTAATTVDVNSMFVVTQTTASQILTLPNPTSVAGARLVTVQNAVTSTQSFVMYGQTLAAGESVDFIWNGLAWSKVGVDATTESLTYGRVRANLDLASTTHVNTDPGTKIPFTIATYLSGMTDNAGSLIPSVSGRYRADWLCMAASTDFLADGIFHVVQNGVSVGQVSYNMNEASAVNQSAGFIDVNLVAGQEVSLNYRTRHTASDGIAWDRGSYFQLTQLPTAVAPVVDTVAEYGEQILASTPIVNTTADITNGTFTLPSAGVWDVEYFVFAATIGGNETATVFVTDPSNIVVANSYAKTGTVPTPAGNTGNMVSQKVRIITTGATNYKLRATTAGTQVTLAAGGATSKVSWTKIAGQLSSSISTDATFANPNNLSVPTTQATKTYVDSKISNNTNYVDIGTTRIQWGTNAGGAGVQTYSFPVPFANNAYVITANAQTTATTFLESVHLERVSASQFQAVAMYVDGGSETPNSGRTFFWTAIGLKP